MSSISILRCFVPIVFLRSSHMSAMRLKLQCYNGSRNTLWPAALIFPYTWYLERGLCAFISSYNSSFFRRVTDVGHSDSSGNILWQGALSITTTYKDSSAVNHWYIKTVVLSITDIEPSVHFLDFNNYIKTNKSHPSKKHFWRILHEK